MQTALSAEHAAVYGYGVIGAHLTGADQAAASRDWLAHQMARDDLEATLQITRRSAGGRRARLPAARSGAHRA